MSLVLGLLLAIAATNTEGAAARRVTVVTFGDSTTAPRGPLVTFSDLLAKELPAKGIEAKVVNAGVGGNTTVLARKRFARDALSHNPDVVTIAFGINDSAVDVSKGETTPRVPRNEYKKNLRYFVRACREHGARPILMTPNPLAWTPQLKEMYGKPPYEPEDPDGFNVTLRDYAATVRRIAKTERVPLVDVYDVFGKQAKAKPSEPLLLDGMHPNDAGHRLVADALLAIIPEALATDTAP